MFCRNCACELPAVAKFCVRCGSRVEYPVTAQAQQSVASPSLQEQPRVPPVDSRKAEFPDSEVLPPYPYAKGSRFVVPRDSVLPEHCVKCANRPTDPWLRKTFSWHHPGIYILILSPIVYIIVALIVRKTVRLAVPLCQAHKSIRKKRLWIAGILLVGCIPLPSALAVYVGNDAADVIAVWLGIAMFVASLLFLFYASPIRATRIGPGSAEFAGASKDFLDALGHADGN